QNHSELDSKILAAPHQAIQDRLYDARMIESTRRVQSWSEPRFGIHDAVALHVFHEFIRHAFQRFLRLHHAAGVYETFQVERQTPPRGSAMKPVPEFFR